VRFHEDTALLIAAGDHDQLEAIEHVLDSLNESVSHRRDDEMRQYQMQLQEIDQDRQHARDRQRQATAEAQQTREENTAHVQEIARLEMVTAELRRMLDTKDRELTAVMADLRALQLELQQERSRREPGRSNPGD
jgi:chromosome segregation ATPase